MKHANLIRALDLENWADTIGSRDRLPQVVRRLIHATVEDVVRIGFPSAEGVQRPGFDGIVEAPTGNAFVPAGLSVWELGTNQDPHAKAEGDFAKRLKEIAGPDRAQLTFLVATPRKWIGKAKWAEEKNKLKLWKEVRAYDSADIEEWLEVAPAVDAWLARILGRRPDGITDLRDHWENLTALLRPALTPAVFLACREKEVTAVADWLSNAPSALAFEADSPGEVLDFFCAHLSSLDADRRDALESRILIVETAEAWRNLSAATSRLVLVPRPPLSLEPEMVAEAVRRGHHVLLGTSRLAGDRVARQTLARPFRFELAQALVAAGFEEETAQRMARESRGSLTVLKRCFSRFPGTKHPGWSRPPDDHSLVPILLLGAWDDACESDRAAVARIAGQPCEAFMSVVHRWGAAEDPPVMRVKTTWSVLSREDSWPLLAPQITRLHLEAYEAVAVEVLGEDDPRYELPVEERWMASLHKKVPKFSKDLRAGLAETLAILGAKAAAGAFHDPVALQRLVASVIGRVLPAGAVWERWASLSPHLPLLAEAAPERFLEAVEHDLRAPKPQISLLFEQEGKGFSSGSPHTGLLWALETLAWHPAYLSRVALILARLAGSDPGGRLANRPKASLRWLFHPQFPQTAASAGQRIAVLDLLLKRHPTAGWTLLLSLLPGRPEFVTRMHRPAWRDWPTSPARQVVMADYPAQVASIADRLLTQAGSDIGRWEQLIDAFARFPRSAQTQFLPRLRELRKSSLSEDDRRRISNALRAKQQWHRAHPGAPGTLPDEVLCELEDIRRQFEPADPVLGHAWLFARHLRFPEDNARSLQELDQALFSLRQSALQHVFASGGLQAVLRLAMLVEDPAAVGVVLAKAELLTDDASVLPALLQGDDGPLRAVARGYARGRYIAGGWAWVDALPLCQWPVEAASVLLRKLPFERLAWDCIDRMSPAVAEHYWAHVRSLNYELTAQDVAIAAEHLWKRSRPFHAIAVLGFTLTEKTSLPSELMLQALERAGRPQPSGEREENLSDRVADEICALLLRLQNDPSTDPKRLASLEWIYLPFLDRNDHAPKRLQESLQNDPAFFAELLCLLYYGRHEPRVETAPLSEQQRARGERGHKLLANWHTLPGTGEEGTVDTTKLSEWIRSARELCQAADRLEICDSRIGELLAYAPSETDGSWPCIAVREVIEEVGSVALCEGFQCGIGNKRGVVSRLPTEGGLQEWELARQFAGYAEACAAQWPMTAASLRKIADEYTAYARAEDEEIKENF